MSAANPCPSLKPALVFFVILTTGCNARLPGKPNPQDRPITEEKILAFDALYNHNCAGCHGKDGKSGPAPPLNDALFRAIVPVEELEKTLAEGRKQGQIKTAMPAFAHANGGQLSKEQVSVLVHEIKGQRYWIDRDQGKVAIRIDGDANKPWITPSWGMVSAAPTSTPGYLLESGGDAKHGAQLFVQACAKCHGENGVGVNRDGKWSNKINDPAFLTLISDQALRRIIITGRPDLKMPNHAETMERTAEFKPLTSSQITDLVALLRDWRDGKTK